MSLLVEEDTSSRPPSLGPTIIKWIVVVVLICAVLIALLLGVRVVKPLLTDEKIEVEDTSIPADAFTPSSVLDGDLVLGIVAIDTADSSKTGVKTAIYRTEADGGVEIPDVNVNGDIVTPFQLNFSKDTTFATFIGEDAKGSNGTELYKAVIDKAALSGSEALTAQLNNAVELPASDDIDFLRLSPAINGSGFVLYASAPKSGVSNAGRVASTSIDAWTIYLVNDENERVLVTRGYNPKWVNGSSFAFVQKDGVYVYDLDHNTSTRVWESHELELTSANGFAVSNDLLSFALSDRDIPVSVYGVGDWESPEVVLIAKGDAYASSIEFSLDDEYVGAVVKRVDGESISFGVEYFSVEEQKFIEKKLSMDNGTITGLYISDWQ